MHYTVKAIELSQQIGNKQAESSQLGILARIYFEMRQIPEPIETMQFAIDIKKIIAVNNELCKLYLNITNINIALNQREDANNSAKKCYLLAQELNNYNLEQSILFLAKMNDLII